MSDTSTSRIHAKEVELVPRVMVRIMFGFVAVILALVTVARLTDRPLESTPAQTPIISERLIYISGDNSGAARILDETGSVLATFDADKGGFVAGIDRVIRRERNLVKASVKSPLALRLREGNRLSLFDPETGWSAELMGFGADNLRTFARLLEAPTAKEAN